MTILIELTPGHIATNAGEYDEPPEITSIELAGQDIPYTAKVWNKAEEQISDSQMAAVQEQCEQSVMNELCEVFNF